MSGIYLHIPFCTAKCRYCNFYSSPSVDKVSQVVDAMLKELNERAVEWKNKNISTLYFGGGTPSLIDPDALGVFVDEVKRLFVLSPDAEITIEVNPDDVNVEKAVAWQTLGINRISLGVQSFDDAALKFMGRRHNGNTAEDAIRTLISAGFENISIDLIYGVPDRSDKVFEADIEKAINLGAKHISAYALTVEEGTALSYDIIKGKISPVDPDMAAAQFEILLNRLSLAGIEQYEISNFAYTGYHSRHNSSYWQGVPYLGIGPSAHSFDGWSRRWNVSNLHKYITAVNSSQSYSEMEILSETDRQNEMIMISLRTSRGLCLADFEEKFGSQALMTIKNGLEPHVGNNLVKISEGFARLTDKGKFLADGIASDLFVV